jgi:AFG3 family protein
VSVDRVYDAKTLSWFAHNNNNPDHSRNSLLARGLVSSLEVVNRTKVRVHLHSPIQSNTGVTPSADGTGSLPSPAHGPAPYTFTIGSLEAFEALLIQTQDELGIPPAERIPVSYREEISTMQTILHFAPSLLIAGLLLFMARRGAQGAGGAGGGIFGVGKSKAKMFNKEEDVAMRFADVAGMDEAKEVRPTRMSFAVVRKRLLTLGCFRRPPRKSWSLSSF